MVTVKRLLSDIHCLNDLLYSGDLIIHDPEHNQKITRVHIADPGFKIFYQDGTPQLVSHEELERNYQFTVYGIGIS